MRLLLGTHCSQRLRPRRVNFCLKALRSPTKQSHIPITQYRFESLQSSEFLSSLSQAV